ncbi:MAG: PEP-CTERM sorting domain-containing protein, partial [Planctomycetes bacterium]|nr:PEP-CTERM sorting domain-containing protein [Planctomycetota bacterium]
GISYPDSDEAALQEIDVLGRIGGEEILDVYVPRNSQYDLLGYQVERIDRQVTFSIRTVVDGTGENSAVFYNGGVYEVWGSVVPEPATLCLLATGAALVMRRRRRHPEARGGRSVAGCRGRLSSSLLLLIAIVAVPVVARADSIGKNSPLWSLWRTGTECPAVCPDAERYATVSLDVGPLTEAQGNVAIEITPFADLSDNADGGNGYGYYEVLIGGTMMTSSVTGHVSGVRRAGRRPALLGSTEPAGMAARAGGGRGAPGSCQPCRAGR